MQRNQRRAATRGSFGLKHSPRYCRPGEYCFAESVEIVSPLVVGRVQKGAAAIVSTGEPRDRPRKIRGFRLDAAASHMRATYPFEYSEYNVSRKCKLFRKLLVVLVT